MPLFSIRISASVEMRFMAHSKKDSKYKTGWAAWFTPSMGNRWNGFAPVCWKRRARPWL